MAQQDKKAPDWERIEADYRAGLLSVREIAAAQGVSHVAIGKRAKRDGWERSLKPSRNVILAPEIDELDRSGFLYVIYVEVDDAAYYKVGIATHFDSRLKTHQCSSPFEVKVAICYFVGNMRAEERALHKMFECKRVRGEWFALDADDLRLVARRAVLQ
ncbi:GIY-YIG nuclease family protein [Luteibacter sp.]|jgi:hypothetical protein|uniref:GIY-YIG nuclease family protein n=1 Tax=Luteibacter sp. TaxID=1886636 RepID=UPI002F3EE5DA